MKEYFKLDMWEIIQKNKRRVEKVEQEVKNEIKDEYENKEMYWYEKGFKQGAADTLFVAVVFLMFLIFMASVIL